MMYKLSLFMLALFLTSPLLAQKHQYKSSETKVILTIQLEYLKAEANSKNKTMKLPIRNEQGTSEFDAKTGQITFSLPLNGFKFQKKSLQKSFDSAPIVKDNKDPNVTFKGRILNFKRRKLRKSGVIQVAIEGDLTMRGVTKPIKAAGTLIPLKSGQIKGNAQFDIPDASAFASNAKEQKGLTEEVKAMIKVDVQVTYDKKKKK